MPAFQRVEDGYFAAAAVRTRAGGRAVVQDDVAPTVAAFGQGDIGNSGAAGVYPPRVHAFAVFPCVEPQHGRAEIGANFAAAFGYFDAAGCP